MTTHNAEQIADTIIHLARQRDIEITNLKLQKLLYYAQAWNLVFESEPIFRESIEAWVHGPVVPAVFRKFRAYRWNAIDCNVTPTTDARVIGNLNLILDAYGHLSATQLEHLSHKEEPWRVARGSRPIDEPSNEIIERNVMQQFYSSLVSVDL